MVGPRRADRQRRAKHEERIVNVVYRVEPSIMVHGARPDDVRLFRLIPDASRKPDRSGLLDD